MIKYAWDGNFKFGVPSFNWIFIITTFLWAIVTINGRLLQSMLTDNRFLIEKKLNPLSVQCPSCPRKFLSRGRRVFDITIL